MVYTFGYKSELLYDLYWIHPQLFRLFNAENNCRIYLLKNWWVATQQSGLQNNNTGNTVIWLANWTMGVWLTRQSCKSIVHFLADEKSFLLRSRGWPHGWHFGSHLAYFVRHFFMQTYCKNRKSPGWNLQPTTNFTLMQNTHTASKSGTKLLSSSRKQSPITNTRKKWKFTADRDVAINTELLRLITWSVIQS